ncbi:ribosomal protein S18-alanine N-acetyltransferase [Aromatoleum bremense]|nr:ribosomal protein S18-alanine N-acetyltransferase [Aromatoleum bremense]QTQ33978.1 putative ribosomal-protein-alanine acetyltransferase [Aromatoleum bremense]
MNAAASDFSPMTDRDLDWVVDHEAVLHTFPWSRGNFVDSLAAGHSAWVMRVGGSPVAYAVMLMVLDEAHLLNISVAREFQGARLGTALLRHLFAEARRCGASQFFLEVRPSNSAALALYRSHGFQPIGRRKGYYALREGGREDAIVMRLEL